MKGIIGQKLRNQGDKPTTSFPASSFATKSEYSDRDSRASFPFPEMESRVTADTDSPGVRCNTLVLGMGSEFLGDDGVGVHAVRALANEALPNGTELIELADHLVDALVALQKADRVILLDVLRAQGKPGSVYRVSFQPFQISGGIPLSHNHDLFRALHLGGCFGFLDVIVIGMEPSMIDLSASLSVEVRNALPLMIRAVIAELNRPAMRYRIGNRIAFAMKAEPNAFKEDIRRYT
jgi:hydrogenase maturation protease